MGQILENSCGCPWPRDLGMAEAAPVGGKLLALNDTLQLTNFSATEPVEFKCLLAGTD